MPGGLGVRLPREIDPYGTGHRLCEAALTFGGCQALRVLEVGDEAGLEQRRGNIGCAQHYEGRRALRLRVEVEHALSLAKDQRSKFVRLFLGPPLRQLDEDRVDVLVPPGEAYPVDHIGTVLARCEPLRGLARGPGRERIDAGPADSRLLARRTVMNREEQVRSERPGDPRTLPVRK